MKKILLAVVTFLLLLTNCCYAASLKVKMLNVGQGDAILIQTDNSNVLIDTSDADERLKLCQELYKADAFTLDKVILTHPHADHIGNAAYLIKNGVFTVRTVYDNGAASTSKYYKDYMRECASRGVPRYTLRAGDTLTLDDGVVFEVLSADTNDRNINNNSIVGRLVCGDFKMLLTGDAEALIEGELDGDISADVLKAGHHGSKTSNTLGFVSAVNPKYVLISAGEPTTKRGGNTYGHPHAQALDNFLLAGVSPANIFWTHKNGTITIETDGTTTTVTPEFADNWVNEYLGYRLEVRKIA